MERLRERLLTARDALSTLQELIDLENPSRVERDAAIQRFEYTFEACWKTAQRYLLVAEGLRVGSPKSCMRTCREVGLLSEEQAIIGLEMVDDRNLTVHTYDETVAVRIYRNLGRYTELLAGWMDVMNERVKEEKGDESDEQDDP